MSHHFSKVIWLVDIASGHSLINFFFKYLVSLLPFLVVGNAIFLGLLVLFPFWILCGFCLVIESMWIYALFIDQKKKWILNMKLLSPGLNRSATNKLILCVIVLSCLCFLFVSVDASYKAHKKFAKHLYRFLRKEKHFFKKKGIEAAAMLAFGSLHKKKIFPLPFPLPIP